MQNPLPSVQIRPGFQKRLLQGFPWLYANEILDIAKTKDLIPGELISVQFQEKPIGWGYFNRHSLIAFRLLSRDMNEKADSAFFARRLLQSKKNRETFYPEPFYRLIHAEADNMPGLIVDRYDDVFVVQVSTQGMEKLLDLLLAALHDIFQPKTIIVGRGAAVRLLEGLTQEPDMVIGEPIDFLKVKENDLLFEVAQNTSQKTGWFYDHRENRRLLRKISSERSVIDYYSYSGGFALNAAKAGAKSVISVDRSEAAVENGKRSATLNKLENMSFVVSDTFKDMDVRLSNQEKFDVVVLDPPAFVKSKKDLKSGLKGYEKLLGKAVNLVADSGFLLIASCSYHVSREDLQTCLVHSLQKAQRPASILQNLGAGFDHPSHPQLPESVYLKGFLVRF